MSTNPSDLWLLFRRPLALLFFCGCAVSMWTSGRFSARLIADGAVSFAFVPAFQVLAFAIAYRRGPQSQPFAGAADRFFAGNTPWLVWLTASAALRGLLSAEVAGAPPLLLWRAVQASALGVIVWSARVDRAFFRDVLSRPAEDTRDLILQRAVSWGCAGVYFFGIAIWPRIVGRVL